MSNRDHWYQNEIDEMLVKVSELKSPGAVSDFFEKILTPRELNDMGRRLAIWNMLEAGASYQEIQVKLAASPNIISRISGQIGFGFRRTNQNIKLTKNTGVVKRKNTGRRPIRYKGAPTVSEVINILK